jgi:hypothetical protein
VGQDDATNRYRPNFMTLSSQAKFFESNWLMAQLLLKYAKIAAALLKRLSPYLFLSIEP